MGLDTRLSFCFCHCFDLLSEWLPKNKFVWKKRDFVKAASAKKGRSQNKGTEILVMNYNKQ